MKKFFNIIITHCDKVAFLVGIIGLMILSQIQLV